MKLTTQTLQIFDPAMCCSTGVCGPEVDPKLVQFGADLDWLKTQGIIVQRHNLSQNPAAFVETETVKTLLAEKGEAALPVILVNGKVAATGRYPERGELAAWFQLEDKRDLPKQPAAACDSECDCHTPGQPRKRSRLIGGLVLAVAGVLVARGLIKSGQSSAPGPTPGYAALFAPRTPTSVPAPAGAMSVGPTIGTLSELDRVAIQTDAVFIFLPGKGGVSEYPSSTAMNGAVRRLESKGLRCGVFTLNPGSPDYQELAKEMSVPGVVAMVKGHGMATIAGDLTETKLVQGYVAAASAGGCGSSPGAGCCPGQ
jgi:hypothetical protein